MQAFTSKYIFDGVALRQSEAVLVDQGLIKDIVAVSDITSDIKLTNFGDGVITPGFIDLQVNGCGGVLFNDQINRRALETMYITWLKFGTTSFLPTFITDDFSKLITALEVVKDWFSEFGNRKGVVGIHIEGPFISKSKPGIHPVEFIIPPTMELLQQIALYRKYFPIKMTIATEKFSKEQIKFLIDNDIILSLGHTGANYQEAMDGISLGITTATHMFNAMTGLTGRNPGAIGAILNSDILTGIIVDMLHVDGANIQLLNKIKSGQVYLVTDAVTPAGTNIEQFDFGGKTVYVADGKCTDQDGVLAGAVLTMNDAIRNCVDMCNLSLTDSLAMATSVPAKAIKLDHILGNIKSGYLADLVYLDLQDFSCKICKEG